ncbi:hypothetical protein OIU76_008356 [Salix suchowensis]|uniref:Uncharacterized protein n=1 Tax=Salix purpurea TaxID=77065 RepID=A0A9Q0SRT0_SALPP|nr:hypothetical protein OIU76_008356 [Salix suchowensis]KAJ6687000.1 hypothetical protein OIU79_016692 [Salix purpurea]
MEVSLRSFCIRTMLVLVVFVSVNAGEEKDEQRLRLKETQELLSSKNSSMADWYDDAWSEHTMEDPEIVAEMVDE